MTISLLVQALNPDIAAQLALYQQLVEKMQQHFGNDEQQQPLSLDGLQLMYGENYLMGEAKAKVFSSKSSFFSLKIKPLFFKVWALRLQNMLGAILMKLNVRLGKAKWGSYKEATLLNSDYRKLDDTFRSVFAAKKIPLAEFENWLKNQEQAGKLLYGLHISAAAQLICLISQVGVKHIHFVDGCDGGYALAAKSLKLKLKQK